MGKRKRRALTDAIRQRILDMAADGIHRDDIAEDLGYAPRTISNVMCAARKATRPVEGPPPSADGGRVCLGCEGYERPGVLCRVCGRQFDWCEGCGHYCQTGEYGLTCDDCGMPMAEYLPTSGEISRACRDIRATWGPREREYRRHNLVRHGAALTSWDVPDGRDQPRDRPVYGLINEGGGHSRMGIVGYDSPREG